MDLRTQELLLGTVLFTLVTLVIFIIARYTYLIRKAMAENGLKTGEVFTRSRLLHLGGILIGLGVGLMVSAVFTLADLKEDTADLLIWGTIVLFGGLGLLVAHYLERKVG